MEKNASIRGILNQIQMTETISTSGQPTREQFSQIAEAGFKAVVNLGMPNSDNAIPDEGKVVTELGMQYVHIPVPFDNPNADHLKSFLHTMRGLEGERVWVHCVVNARVSAFMYQYLRFEKGYEVDAAKNDLLKSWEPEMDAVWKRFMSLNQEDIR
jgi:protein tyrosine phosphatase (PTP) superfamily phosphohydrolase (DUF442 family)